MAVHLLRDYQTQNLTTTARRYIPSYLLSLYLRRVLGYSFIGSTNFQINSVGTLLISTGDTTPTVAPTFPPGNKAGINIGFQKEFYVTIPAAVRVVSGVDIGRLLVLKSATKPTFNSGVFLVVGFDTASNSYIIDYRTLGETPPIEAADSLQWWLYEKDISCPINGAPNTKTTAEYRGDGNSATPRIILQSPHATGWQVRICNESTSDLSTITTNANQNCPAISVSPGFGGNSTGDFPVFGQHFHAPMWYNSSSNTYLGGAPGMGDINGAGFQFRITIVGDDTGQGITMYCRRPTNALTPSSTITCFGLAENEPTPLPVNNFARLFVIGTGYTDGGARSNDGGFQVGRVNSDNPNSVAGYTQGMTATPFGVPTTCSPSLWTQVSTGANSQGSGTAPHFDSFATDNPFTNSTELLPVDLMQGAGATTASVPAVGTWLQSGINDLPVYPFAPRTMGTIPHIREGRANFGDFSPTTDVGRTYQHLRRGLYIPWNGPNLIP
jgi:hypothetical protein